MNEPLAPIADQASAPAPQPVTHDHLKALHDRIDALLAGRGEDQSRIDALEKNQAGHAAALAALGKETKSTAKAVATVTRDWTKVQPKNVHEAIQRLKAEGSKLIGPALREAAVAKFFPGKPKPASAAAPKA